MKKMMFLKSHIFFLFFMFVLFYFTFSVVQAQTISSGKHIRKGVRKVINRSKEFVFNDSPKYDGLVSTLSMEHIRREFNEEVLKYLSIEYWIHDTIDNAELALVERLELSSLGMDNSIHNPMPEITIGDNCWYQSEGGTIAFVRNNVFVYMRPSQWGEFLEWNVLTTIARKIDDSIVKAKTVDKTSMQTPKIHSVDLLTERPINWGQTVKVLINATDPNSQELYFRKVGDGLGIIRRNGDFTIRLDKSVPACVSKDTNKFRILIWVWNEEHRISLVNEEMFF